MQRMLYCTFHSQANIKKENNMKTLTIRALLLIALTLFIGSISVGCNTMEGMGEDIQRGGEEIEDAAD